MHNALRLIVAVGLILFALALNSPSWPIAAAYFYCFLAGGMVRAVIDSLPEPK